MTTPTTQQAEALWVTAHEHVRRGDFASATRDLAQCFAILQANNDPRLPEVHRRWTEVHQLAVEEAAQGRTVTAQPAQAAPSLEAEAEAEANAGNLDEAIVLYERALAQRPDNELVAERLLELKNARPRAAALTSTAPVGAFDEEALAASIDLSDDFVDDSGVGGGTGADGEPAVPKREADDNERADALEDTLDFVPAAALASTSMREDDFGDVVPAIVRAEAAERAEAPRPAILRDDAVERSIAVEPIADDDEATALVSPAIVRDDAVERSIAVEPIANDDEATALVTPAIVRDDAVERSIAVEPIADDDIAPAAAVDAVALAEHALSLSDDDVNQTNIHDAVTLVPHREAAIVDDAPAKTTAKMYLEDVGVASKITASMYLDDLNAAATSSSPLEGLTSDVVASRLLVATELSTDAVHPAQAHMDEVVDDLASNLGDDSDRGGTSTTPDAISGDDPRWGTPAPAVDAVSGDDPRWGRPHAATAPLMAVADAPVGMPSLELDIDMGSVVSGAEADELPVNADDLMMVGDDDIMAQSLPPQPAMVVAEVLADGFPADPEAMLNAVLQRVRNNRRAA